jgi:hypothetical protein
MSYGMHQGLAADRTDVIGAEIEYAERLVALDSLEIQGVEIKLSNIIMLNVECLLIPHLCQGFSPRRLK